MRRFIFYSLRLVPLPSLSFSNVFSCIQPGWRSHIRRRPGNCLCGANIHTASSNDADIPQTTASAQFSIAVGFVWAVGPLAHFLNQRLWIRLAWAFIFLLPIWQGPQLLTLINQQWVLPRNNSWITSAIRPFPYLQDAWKGQKFPNFPVSKVLWRKTVNQRLIRYMKMQQHLNCSSI